jgi:tRNA/tmRNA/rRNA uracil-C5-methylase (TrmA/RlmC/RlmD family)
VPEVGDRLDLEVGAAAHGGTCVARHEGLAVFVRHALPGELVTAAVTEVRREFARADAVDVLRPSADRVTAPCPWAGPGRCGGCDWQHVDPAEQRRLKAAVVREQLARLARLEDVEVTVEELPGGPLRWRSRARFAVDRSGAPGLRRHRSHDVVVLDDCPITVEPAARAVLGRSWPGAGAVDVSIDSTGAVTTTRLDRRGHPEAGSLPAAGGVGVEPAARAERRAGGRDWEVEGTGFWQVHPGAAEVLLDTVLAGLDPQPGESALDLYCGVGLFAATLAERLGPGGRVTAVESDPTAVADARHNLAALPTVRIERGRVDHVLRRLRLRRADLVVLDPPRSGAGKAVVDLLSRVKARRIAYVACDPAALARDLKWFRERGGYELVDLRAFDLFPMTAHVECVAILRPAPP